MDSPDYIALVSAVFSGAAAFFAVLAFWQSRRSTNASDRSADAADRSARSAEQLTEIQASRHYEERRPHWAVKLDGRGCGNTGPMRLGVEPVSPEDVDEVVVLSVDGKRTFRDSQEGANFGTRQVTRFVPRRHAIVPQ